MKDDAVRQYRHEAAARAAAERERESRLRAETNARRRRIISQMHQEVPLTLQRLKVKGYPGGTLMSFSTPGRMNWWGGTTTPRTVERVGWKLSSYITTIYIRSDETEWERAYYLLSSGELLHHSPQPYRSTVTRDPYVWNGYSKKIDGPIDALTEALTALKRLGT